PRPVAAALAVPEGCVAMAEGGLACGGTRVAARLLRFDPASNWAAVAAARRSAAGTGDDEALTFQVNGPGMAWQVRREAGRRALVAVGAWRDGVPAGDGLRARLAQAASALRGGGPAPVLAVVEIRPDEAASTRPGSLRGLVAGLLLAQQDGLARQAASLSRTR
ncbi:hypothetical protein, partial [Falsiroseomonas selenitidurans]